MTNQAFENVTEQELERLAHLLAPLAQPGDFIALEGELGAGKSVFARAFIRTIMGQNELDVPSPTYNLVQTYAPPAPLPEIWHVDLYRLEKPEDLIELGLEDAGRDAVLLVEWPDRLARQVPSDILKVAITRGPNENLRHVELTPGASWKDKIGKINLIRQ